MGGSIMKLEPGKRIKFVCFATGKLREGIYRGPLEENFICVVVDGANWKIHMDEIITE